MILVTGVTGKTGGEVARQLTAANLPFRAVVRNPDKADGIAGPGVDIALGDIADADFLRQALTGIDKALLVMPNDEHQLQLEKQFTDIAVESGVKHLLYLSSIESVAESTNPITMSHVAAENHIRAANLAWTMLRPTFFMQNFAGSVGTAKSTGKLSMPMGKGNIGMIDCTDVGAFIAHVTTDENPEQHHSQCYDISGPDEIMTFDKIATAMGEVIGREVEYDDCDPEFFKEVLRPYQRNAWHGDAVAVLFAEISDGTTPGVKTSNFQNIMGRPGPSLKEFLQKVA